MIDPIASHALAAFGGFAAALPLIGAAWRRRRRAALDLRHLQPRASSPERPPSERMWRIAHELNNILTAVGGFAELARARTEHDPDAAASLDQIVLGVQRATLVVRRLAGPAQAEATPGAGTVLVVDDDVLTRDAAALMLLDHGFVVHRAAGGADALAVVDSAPGAIDVVLTDVMMPHMTGPELARLLAERHPGVAIVYMSGYEHRRLANERMIGRDDACIAKPFASDQLIAVVHSAMAKARNGGKRRARTARVA